MLSHCKEEETQLFDMTFNALQICFLPNSSLQILYSSKLQCPDHPMWYLWTFAKLFSLPKLSFACIFLTRKLILTFKGHLKHLVPICADLLWGSHGLETLNDAHGPSETKGPQLFCILWLGPGSFQLVTICKKPQVSQWMGTKYKHEME